MKVYRVYGTCNYCVDGDQCEKTIACYKYEEDASKCLNSLLPKEIVEKCHFCSFDGNDNVDSDIEVLEVIE